MSEKSAKEIYKTRIADYDRTFGTDHGQRVLKDLIKEFGGDPFDGNPFVMAAAVGGQRPIRRIRQYLSRAKDPKKYIDLFDDHEVSEFDIYESIAIAENKK